MIQLDDSLTTGVCNDVLKGCIGMVRGQSNDKEKNGIGRGFFDKISALIE